MLQIGCGEILRHVRTAWLPIQIEVSGRLDLHLDETFVPLAVDPTPRPLGWLENSVNQLPPKDDPDVDYWQGLSLYSRQEPEIPRGAQL